MAEMMDVCTHFEQIRTPHHVSSTPTTARLASRHFPGVGSFDAKSWSSWGLSRNAYYEDPSRPRRKAEIDRADDRVEARLKRYRALGHVPAFARSSSTPPLLLNPSTPQHVMLPSPPRAYDPPTPNTPRPPSSSDNFDWRKVRDQLRWLQIRKEQLHQLHLRHELQKVNLRFTQSLTISPQKRTDTDEKMPQAYSPPTSTSPLDTLPSLLLSPPEEMELPPSLIAEQLQQEQPCCSYGQPPAGGAAAEAASNRNRRRKWSFSETRSEKMRKMNE